jgi:hypothetical protein
MVFEENVGCYSFERYCSISSLSELSAERFEVNPDSIHKPLKCKLYKKGEPKRI